jgi:hypothetical protein
MKKTSVPLDALARDIRATFPPVPVHVKAGWSLGAFDHWSGMRMLCKFFITLKKLKTTSLTLLFEKCFQQK